MHLDRTLIPALLTLAVISAQAEDDLLIITDESEQIIFIDDSEPDEIVLETDIIDLTESQSEQLIVNDIDNTSNELILDQNTSEEDSFSLSAAQPSNDSSENTHPNHSSQGFNFKVDNLWLELGHFSKSDIADNQGYLHSKATANWAISNQWEVELSARLDGYIENGDNNENKLKIDYDESFIRYKASQSIFTIGAQKILWGRIDEFPPTDQLSTQDFRRFVLDDLQDRRLASPALRYEHFFKAGKIDAVIYPHFREAEMPDQNSVWYPVKQKTGEILGIETTSDLQNIIKNTPIKEDAPHSAGGAGLRFSSLGTHFDYAITVQRGRPTTPYFNYNPTKNVIETLYPKTWILGGDIGFEALGGTLKFEATWLSDTPITKTNGSYTTKESINWGAALELFPGDGDTRINLQVIGKNVLNAPSAFDKTEVYTFNGSIETPFADNQWRFKTRFYSGLGNKDFYLNPELTFIGWDSQEIYIELHYFDGEDGTAGGFYEDNRLLGVGWRISF